MILASTIALILLAIALGLISTVQQLYLESQRLRAREAPMQQFFRNTLEQKFGFSIEDGSMAFSLFKHGALLLVGISMLAFVVDGSGMNVWSLLQAAFSAWVFMMFFAYVIPQLLARGTSGKWMLPLIPSLRFCARLMIPVVRLLHFMHSLVDITKDDSLETETPSPAENIDALITAGAEEGLIEEDDRRLIQSVVEFGDKVVREVMTARPNMVAIRSDATLEQLRQLVIHEQYSRIPVYEGSIDHIVGFRACARYVRA